MRNRTLDGSADRTDLVIVFVFTRVEFAVLWLLSRRDVARPLKSNASGFKAKRLGTGSGPSCAV